MDIINFIVLSVFLLNIFLLLVVHFRALPSKANIAFQFTILAIAGWCISMFIYRYSPIEYAEFWVRLLYFFPPFIPAGFLIFGLYFPDKAVKKSFIQLIMLSSLLLGLVTLIPGMVINSIVPLLSTEKIIVFGQFYWIYFLYIPLLFTTCFIVLIKRSREVSKHTQKQIWYILVGLGFATLPAMFTNLILPTLGVFSLNWLGQVLTSIWVVFVTYAIVKHKFVELKIIVARAVAYSVLILVVAVIYIGSVFWSAQYLLRQSIDTVQLPIFAFVTLFIAFTFQPLKKYIETLTDKIFFKNSYDAQELLSTLTKTMATTLQLEVLIKRILSELTQAMKIDRSLVSVMSSKGVHILASEGYKDPPQLDPTVIQQLILEKRPLIRNQEEDKIKLLMEKQHISVFLPLYVGDICQGVLLLGSKKSGELYTEQDLNLLQIFSSEFAVAVQNALSYEEIKRFNATLTNEVDKATKDLQQANIKLKEVDKLKTEFVSLASHELRTPMTAIKSYLWMALKGKGGPLTEKQMYYLDRAYRSTDRLIKLVNDMLNISRIESGRISLQMAAVDILKLSEEVIEEVNPRAQELGITITVNPDALLPQVIADADKIKEVLINLIGNSLKFTPRGGHIVISFSVNTMVEIHVSDNGAGIAPEDISKLFQKFGLLQGSYTVNKTATQGTGLGLYICKSIIELHGGRIGVHSNGVGKGATFSFSLHKFDQHLLEQYQVRNTQLNESVGLVHTQV